MRVGNYSVLVPEGNERDTGHVGLDHGRQYTIRLTSHDHRACDAEVTVDGKSLGGFRLRGHGFMTLERSPEDHGRFTFYTSGSDEAATVGEFGIAAQDKGLIQVRFVPERRRAEPVPTTVKSMGMTRGAGGQSVSGQSMGHPRDQASMGCFPEEKTSGGILLGARGVAGLTGGVTGVSGHSSQQFVTVGPLDRDESEAVTISIRLVTAANGPRPLQPVNAVRGNQVPEPV